MNEFAERVRQAAREALRKEYGRSIPAGTDPVIELISFLLEDGAGGVRPPLDTPVTTEEWLAWNRRVMCDPTGLAEMVAAVLDWELMNLPRDANARRTWAAQLLLSTLDRMATTP
ncbi:MAG: hypothetical protein AB7P22_16990 [Vicinamibacterales bacterium]